MIHVHVKAYGDLCCYLSTDERDNGAQIELPHNTTITHMPDALNLPYHLTWLIGVNDEIVELDHALKDGDEIELLWPIGGG